MDAPQVSLICPAAGSVKARPAGAVGAWVSPVSPVRVTVLLLPDWFPAASLARTKYDTVALAGWVSVKVVTLPATLVRSVAAWRRCRSRSRAVLSVDGFQVSLIWPVAGSV